MVDKTRCEICDRTFKDADGLAAHNKAKHPENMPKEKKPLPIRKVRNWSILIIIVGLIIAGVIWWISNIERLPPIDMDGHIESNPSSHILKDPMPIAIQKHMLEHADGVEKGRGGVIINYNCKDYSCEESLIKNLESFATEFDYVYVAPFKRMDAKIAITKLGKIDSLEEYDEIRIKNFIEER